MKNNSTTTILNWLLTASLLLSMILGFQFFNQTREHRSLLRQVVGYQNRRSVLGLLVNEAAEYSKRNPAILPILESVGIKPAQPASTGVNKPAAK